MSLKGRVADFYRVNGLDSIAEKVYLNILGERDSLTADSLLGSVYSGLSTVLFNQKHYSRAFSNDSLALQIYSRSGNKILLARTYLHIASIQFIRHQFSSAVNILLRKCLPLFTSAGDYSGRSACFDGLGDNYLAMGRTSEAKWFYIQENLLAEKTHNTVAVAASLTGLGNVKSRLGDHNSAIVDLNNAVRFAGNSGSIEELCNAYQGLAKLYSLTGNPARSKGAYAKAYDYAARSIQLKKQRALIAIHARDSVDRASAPVNPPVKSKKSSAKSSSTSFLLFVIFISILLPVILLVLFLRNRKKF